MADIQMFNNGEFELSFTTKGETYIVHATGLARCLSFRSAADMVRNLPADEKLYVLERSSGDQHVWYVTEPGFYRLLGQRQSARVKSPAVRQGVERFQRWVFHDVLPSVMRGQQSQRRNGFGAAVATPDTYTYDEVCAILRQFYGIDLTVTELTRYLRAGGVLKQNGSPTKKYRFLFWFTEASTWNIHKHVIPQVAFKVHDTGREMQDFRFLQARLELEGLGQSFDDAPARRLAA